MSAHAFVYSVSFYSNWGNPSQAQWHHPHPTDISCSATISVDNHCFFPFTKPSQWVRRASRCGSIHYPNFVSLFGLELHFTTSELLSRLKCLSTGEYWWNFLFYDIALFLFSLFDHLNTANVISQTLYGESWNWHSQNNCTRLCFSVVLNDVVTYL